MIIEIPLWIVLIAKWSLYVGGGVFIVAVLFFAYVGWSILSNWKPFSW